MTIWEVRNPQWKTLGKTADSVRLLFRVVGMQNSIWDGYDEERANVLREILNFGQQHETPQVDTPEPKPQPVAEGLADWERELLEGEEM